MILSIHVLKIKVLRRIHYLNILRVAEDGIKGTIFLSKLRVIEGKTIALEILSLIRKIAHWGVRIV
jgi:hypothetical protein